MEYRDPTLINVNWFMVLKDHPKQPEDLLKKTGKLDYTDFQIRRAAGIIRYALEYNDSINK